MNKVKRIGLMLLLLLTLIILPGCSGLSLDLTTEELHKYMYVGDELLLNVSFSDDKEHEVTWESSDVNVAIVTEDGLVRAISVGQAYVSAKADNKESKALIIVEERNTEINYSLEIIGKQSVEINKSLQLIAEITPSEMDQTVNWRSSDTNIATIKSDGSVLAKKPGVVTITATSVAKPSLSKDFTLLVRTGDGVQDVIYNYIYNNNYITSGNIDLTSINNKVVDLVKNVEKSVIGVYNRAVENGKEGVFTGTAGIYKQEKINGGYKYTAFTNHHVIADSKELKVYLGDIDEYVPATVIKSDSNMDIAVITFEHKNNYTPLTLGEIGDVKKGDFVVAIGNPGGFEYYGSVTFGMVSSPNRLFKDRDMIYVQHDAPINPGNSGGPLFNLDGKVIGINTLKFAAADIEGMGFSIAMEKFLDYLK